MKKVVLPIVALLILFLSSCQKELSFDNKVLPAVDTTNASASINSLFLVKNSVIKKGNNVEEYNYTYDQKGRVLTAISPRPDGKKLIYTYRSDNTYTVDISDSTSAITHELSFINSMGYLDSTVRSSSNNMTAEKFVYAGGLVTQVKEYESVNSKLVLKNINSFEYNGDNLIKETNSNKDVQISYTYYDNVNTVRMGLVYFPPFSHLIKTRTFTGTGIVNITVTHTYTFDNLNRVLSEIVVDNSGNTLKTTNYKY